MQAEISVDHRFLSAKDTTAAGSLSGRGCQAASARAFHGAGEARKGVRAPDLMSRPSYLLKPSPAGS